MSVGIAATILGAAIAVYLSIFGHRWNSVSLPQDLAAVPVIYQDITIEVLASGVIYPKHLVSVGAQVSGQVKMLAVKLGENVKEGQVIAKIDSAPQTNAIAKDRASLEMVEAQGEGLAYSAELALLSFKRQASLTQRHFTPKQEFDNARIALEIANSNVRANRAQVKIERLTLDLDYLNLGYTTIRAPIDGTVVSVAVEEGQTVNATQTIPTIVMLADLRRMAVKARLSEADVRRVNPGARLAFTTLGSPERKYISHLTSIDPAPDDINLQTTTVAPQMSEASSSTVKPITYDARFDVDNSDGSLRPFMTAEVSVVAKVVKHALAIPTSAITMSAPGYGTVIVVGDGGQRNTKRVHLGVSDDLNTQILDGLYEGQRIYLPKP